MRPHQTKAARKKYIQAFHASGMIQTQFARESSINIGMLQAWLYKSRALMRTCSGSSSRPMWSSEVSAGSSILVGGAGDHLLTLHPTKGHCLMVRLNMNIGTEQRRAAASTPHPT